MLARSEDVGPTWSASSMVSNRLRTRSAGVISSPVTGSGLARRRVNTDFRSPFLDRCSGSFRQR